MTPELAAACAEAVHVMTADGRVLRGGPASLFVLGGLGYQRTARFLGLPVFRPLVRFGYRLVARNRHFFGRFMFRHG